MEIVLATRNNKKAEELNRMLTGLDVTIRTLEDFPSCPDVEEDGLTFRDNAVKKASTIAVCSGRPAVADDSGLEVDALGGEPGVRSARYAGEKVSDDANTLKLLQEMDGVPDAERGGRFVCCIALAFPNGEVVTFQGFAEGAIGREPRGRSGFGYDPVFYPANHDRTFAEMTPTEKDSMSHRRAALEGLTEYLKRTAKTKT